MKERKKIEMGKHSYDGWEAGDIIRVWESGQDEKYLRRFRSVEDGMVYVYNDESMSENNVGAWDDAEFVCKNPDKSIKE